jgi:hypothetical protein
MRFDNISATNVPGIRTGFIEGLAPKPISFVQNAVSFVSVKGGGGGNTFSIDDTFKNNSFGLTVVDTGTSADFVRVHRTTGQLIVNGDNGQDVVTVGSNDFTPVSSLLTLQADINITNTGGFTKLLMNGNGDSVNGVFVLDAFAGSNFGSIAGFSAGKITYNTADVNGIVLNGATGDEAFFVEGTRSIAPVQINGFSGSDNFVVGDRNNTLDSIQGVVTVSGNSGNDKLTADDFGSTVFHFYQTTATQVKRLPDVVINDSGLESVEVLPSPVLVPTFTFPPGAKNLKFPSSITAGASATLTGHLADANRDKNLTLTVNWGDGSESQKSHPGTKPFAVKHKYAKAGTYTVHVTWTNSTGQSNSKDLRLSVTPKLAKPGLAHAATSAHTGTRR